MKIGLRQSPETDFQSMIKKIFPFLIIMSFFKCPSSDDEESVTVRAELIVHLKGGLVCLHNVLISAECSY